MGPRLALALVAAAVAACLGQTDAKFIVESHSLVVTGPKDIKGEYTSALANFGVPLYGFTLAGLVVYPESNKDFCHKLVEVVRLQIRRRPPAQHRPRRPRK